MSVNFSGDVNFQIDDENTQRHWSPDSEKYTSGSALLTALKDGWQIDGVVFRQDHWYHNVRRVPVYHIRLKRKNEKKRMVIIHNPFVERIFLQLGVQVVLMNQRKETGNERW